MGLGFFSGCRSFIAISAVAFIALRYAYHAGYRDAREEDEEKARELLQILEEVDDGVKTDMVTRGDAGNISGEREVEIETEGEKHYGHLEENKDGESTRMMKPSREQEGGENSMTIRKCALAGRMRRVSQVVERRIYELGMDAASSGCGTMADWGVD